jgi:hypothetical protein
MVALRCRMPSTGLLTIDDLDEIGDTSFDADQPLGVAAELVDAVDRGLVADQADTGYALILAAEITEREGDLPAALVLAERALGAYRAQGDPDGYSRAFHAGLLLRLGREDEAMAELTALRPLLSEDADAVSYITEALEAGGRAEIAEQWLTEALIAAPQWLEAVESQHGQLGYAEAAAAAFRLAQCRHQIRRELDLPHDAHDHLADVLQEAVLDALSAIEQDDEGTALLFWPQPEFDRLLLRWPTLAEEYGQTWDEYRTRLQGCLEQWSESGHTRLALFPGAVDQLVHYADREGGDPTDPQVLQGYAQHPEENSQETAWPPGRNHECWCGSGLKYKKCCLPRART